MDKETTEKAKRIWTDTGNVKDFTVEMDRQRVFGRKIWYEPQENSIYIIKTYACDFGGGRPTNDTLVGQRRHCEYVNHLPGGFPISYCKCAAVFYGPMFFPIFGENTVIETIESVLSGGEECIVKVNDAEKAALLADDYTLGANALNPQNDDLPMAANQCLADLNNTIPAYTLPSMGGFTLVNEKAGLLHGLYDFHFLFIFFL